MFCIKIVVFLKFRQSLVTPRELAFVCCRLTRKPKSKQIVEIAWKSLEKMAETSSNNVNNDDLILKQKEAIEAEIQASHKLVGHLEKIEILEQQFANDSTFLKNARQLQTKYVNLRRTRPDGNCMYRALAFGQFQRIISDVAEAKKFRKLMENAKEDMVKLNFPVFTMEDFYENFVEQIDSVSRSEETEEKRY